MARPAKQGMDYFPHDTDAASDEKVESLRILYGNDGYAFYFILLERIYRTADFELNVSDAETRQILARKVEVTPQKFEDMLQSALKRGCFDPVAYAERGVITSAGVKKRAENVVGKRQKMASAYSKRVSAAETGEETPPETPQSKGKETKGKETKEEKASSAGAADLASPAEHSQPDSPEAPATPRLAARPKLFRYDAAPVFLAAEFFAFVRQQGYGHVDIPMYLQRTQEAARKGVYDTKKLKEEATNDEWKAFVLAYLDNDKRAKKLLLPDEAPKDFYQPNPALQIVRTSTSMAPVAQHTPKY